MSVNLSLGINPEKTKSFGPLFHTIDYHFNTQRFTIGNQNIKMNSDDIKKLSQDCANLLLLNKNDLNICGYDFRLTNKELKRIIETCDNIKRISHQRYRFFGKT